MISALHQCFPLLGATTMEDALRLEGEWPPIVFSINQTSAADFPVCVMFDLFPGESEESISVSHALARRFASFFGCRALTDGSGLGDDSSPYWSIIWESGQPLLANDCDSALFDGVEGGLVRIARPIRYSVPDLDAAGRLVRSESHL